MTCYPVAQLVGTLIGIGLIGVICLAVCRWQDWRQDCRWRDGTPKR